MGRQTVKEVADAARELREARDLMNHSGRHWIKGAEKLWVDPETHEPGSYDGKMHSYVSNTEPAFCSVGALKEVGARDIAAIALAEVIDPDRMKDERDSLQEILDEPEYYGYQGYEPEEIVLSHLTEVANDVIIDHNDDDRTTWADVRSAFTKAAARLADRARKRKGSS